MASRTARTEDAPPRPVRIPVANATLDADLVESPGARGLVAFAHGSGSSRHSRRNREVAGHLHRASLSTLLLDLLTGDEEREDAVTRAWRFDIPLLAARLVAVTDWLADQPGAGLLPLGYFGASTGAAAALIAAAQRPERVRAVVSRGGRVDLARESLPQVRAPTLLIVGTLDTDVLELNRAAERQMRCEHRLAAVPGATHLFEEPGALDEVSRLASDWFSAHLPVRVPAPGYPSTAQ